MRTSAMFAALLLGAVAAIPAGAASGNAAPAGRGVPAHLHASPGVAEPAGWVPVFASDFSGPSVPHECGLYDGPHEGAAASYYRPDEVAVTGGMLRLSIRRRDFGGRPYTSGGIGCYALAQQYGRYEFRAKAPAGAGIDAYAALWPERGTAADAAEVELFAKPGAEKALLSNRSAAGITTKTVDTDVSAFHTYVIEWAPTGFRILIDDQVKLTDGRISTARRWFGFAVSSGDATTGLPDAETALPAEFQVDFVRVWAYDPTGTGESPSGGGRGGGAASSGSGAGPGATVDAQAQPPRASAIGLRGFAGAHASWITFGTAGTLCVGFLVFGLHRRRPRRPPPAHRA